ncbi:prepilin peptidase [Pseudomonas sp. MM211]|uniref:A24 family peptidase n=1 Tax=Pseudomonas sp. MM211 TaxID=2866808 RepID=UPI001CED56AF|nr:prepilin peptidase [Pseudomonas sp. MM211]UCJ16333.1 prepilin peptidase [Pseudomonas sp. MM211]
MDNTFIVIVLMPALLFVIGTDLLYRRIHNLLILVLLSLWLVLPVTAAFGVGPWGEMSSGELFDQVVYGLLGAALVLVIGYGLFCLGRVGAGDVKLVAAVSLWMCQTDQMAFLIVTALAGGLLALALPLLNQIEYHLALRWQRLGMAFPRLNIPVPVVLTDQRPQGLPYGVAIAIGAFYTLFVPIHS